MKKVLFLLLLFIVACGGSSEEIVVEDTTNTIQEPSTTTIQDTTSTIALKSYKVRVRFIEEHIGADTHDITWVSQGISKPAYCVVENRLLITNPPDAHWWSIHEVNNKRLLKGYFEKGDFEFGPYKDEFSEKTYVEDGEWACYYRFDVSLPEKDAYIFKWGEGEVTFTANQLIRFGGFTITLDTSK
jgi:hypothetical protein